MYECLAENGVGDAVSAEAQLRVYEGTSPFFPLCFLYLDPTLSGRNLGEICPGIGDFEEERRDSRW